MGKKHLILISSFLGTIFLLGSFMPAYTTSILDTTIDHEGQNFIVSFEMQNYFTPEMQEALLHGVPLSLMIDIQVYEPVPYWPDRSVASAVITHIIKYDMLIDEFKVFLGDKNESVKFKNFIEAKKRIGRVLNMKIKTIKESAEDKDYYLRYFLKVSPALEYNRLPFHLEYIFAFLKWGQTKLE